MLLPALEGVSDRDAMRPLRMLMVSIDPCVDALSAGRQFGGVQ